MTHITEISLFRLLISCFSNLLFRKILLMYFRTSVKVISLKVYCSLKTYTSHLLFNFQRPLPHRGFVLVMSDFKIIPQLKSLCQELFKIFVKKLMFLTLLSQATFILYPISPPLSTFFQEKFYFVFFYHLTRFFLDGLCAIFPKTQKDIHTY